MPLTTASLTPFGKYVRTLRIDREEYMKDMAERLDISPAYLSAVEMGRRNVPYDWADRLEQAYGLCDSDVEEVRNLIRQSRTYDVLNVAHLPLDDRRLMGMLCEGLPNLSKERRMILLNWLTET